jgi:hypothetical protein
MLHPPCRVAVAAKVVPASPYHWIHQDVGANGAVPLCTMKTGRGRAAGGVRRQEQRKEWGGRRPLEVPRRFGRALSITSTCQHALE